MNIILDLPMPPSVNAIYQVGRGRSKSGKANMFLKPIVAKYRDEVFVICHQAGARLKLKGDVQVHVEWHLPEGHRRDIDNGLKALLDALQHACVFDNDRQVKSLMVKFQKSATAKAVVSITTL